VQLAVARTALMNKPTLSLEGLHDAFDTLDAAARETAEARGAIVIDAGEAIGADPALFADLAHFSPAGHAAAAEAFAAPVAKALEGRDGL
jgi:lysophospholipase L1-like esterase